MPKPRERVRIVLECDCFDCKDPGEGKPELSAEQLSAATAVARQEPPPKGLVLLLTGVILPAPPASTGNGGSAGEGVSERNAEGEFFPRQPTSLLHM